MITNYFTLLGLPESMHVDDTALHAAYINAQQEFHPDRMVGKPDVERFAAAGKIADINAAYKVLKKPLTRAEHLLGLRGFVVNRDGADAVKAGSGILMQQMEDSEALEEVTDLRGLQLLASDVETRYTNYVMQVTATAESEQWQECAQFTIALKYLDKLLERIRAKRKEL